MSSSLKLVIVGAGPVGSLAALYAASRGWKVEVYELRADSRLLKNSVVCERASISLALSERGLHAIKSLNKPDLVETLHDLTVPMYGRMIHGRDKAGHRWEASHRYDVRGRCILATDRRRLSEVLHTELEKTPNIELFFHHKLCRVDFNRNRAYFERQTNPGFFNEKPSSHEVGFDFLIGADGIHSKTRQQIMRYAQMSYQQTYDDIMWCEFQIPSNKGQHRLPPNHLHIWPANESMFIANPSSDGSFCCTLFAPPAAFLDLSQSPDKLPVFFDHHFPGVTPQLISPQSLHAQFIANPHVPIMGIKCSQQHHGSNVVIVGDAAHAVQPFYGQGLNAGLEDVRILFDTLDQLDGHRSTASRAAALAAYSDMRTPDVHAIYDLSLENYKQLRKGFKSPVYLIRKFVEETLCKYLPSLGWTTQYARVSFSNEPYSNVIRLTKRQGRILLWGCCLMVILQVGWLHVLLNGRRSILSYIGDVKTGWEIALELNPKYIDNGI